MNISPKTLARISWGLILLGSLHLASAVVVIFIHQQKHGTAVVPLVWWLLFYVCGLILLFATPINLILRRGGSTPTRPVDRLAFVVSTLAVIIFITICRL